MLIVGDAIAHRAELVDREGLAVTPDASLAKQHGSGRVEPDRDRDDCDQRREQHEHQRRSEHVERAAARVDELFTASRCGCRLRLCVLRRACVRVCPRPRLCVHGQAYVRVRPRPRIRVRTRLGRALIDRTKRHTRRNERTWQNLAALPASRRTRKDARCQPLDHVVLLVLGEVREQRQHHVSRAAASVCASVARPAFSSSA